MALSSRIFKLVFVPVLILIVGALLAIWLVQSRPRAMAQTPAEKIWSVTTVVVAPADVQPDIVVFGEVRAAREAEIRAMVGGRLVSLNPDFQDGNRVAAGTELAVIDPVDYEIQLAEQRAELARARGTLAEFTSDLEWEQRLQDNAERQVELARRSLERSEALQRDGRESKKARDDAESALTSSRQALLQNGQTIARLRARIEQQQAAFDKAQATLSAAERELAHTRVVAPFDGYLTEVTLALGKLMGVGEKLGRLLAATELEARFALADADFGRLLAASGATEGLLGREVEVIWRLGEIENRFAARLTRIGAEIDPTLGGIEMYAAIDPTAADRGLRAGAFVELKLADVVFRDVFQLPAKALADDGRVYVLRDGRLVGVEVEVVREYGDDLLVRAALGAGDAVVARAFAGIGPGLRAQAL